MFVKGKHGWQMVAHANFNVAEPATGNSDAFERSSPMPKYLALFSYSKEAIAGDDREPGRP